MPSLLTGSSKTLSAPVRTVSMTDSGAGQITGRYADGIATRSRCAAGRAYATAWSVTVTA
jgi:hypothetical protein